jgi:CheY-like chemotaxis protein
MDIQMPEMDGLEAVKRNGLRSLPLPLMLCKAIEKCLAAGMDDYVSKPVKMANLQDILQSCC